MPALDPRPGRRGPDTLLLIALTVEELRKLRHGWRIVIIIVIGARPATEATRQAGHALKQGSARRLGRGRSRSSLRLAQRLHDSFGAEDQLVITVDVIEARTPYGGSQYGGGGYGSGGGGRFNPYGQSRFDQSGFQGSSYQTPGWQRAKERSGRSDYVRPKAPLTLDGELVASSTGRGAGYKCGDRVFHEKFGYGAITDVEGNKLTVEFDKAGTKRVVDSFVVRADKV